MTAKCAHPHATTNTPAKVNVRAKTEIKLNLRWFHFPWGLPSRTAYTKNALCCKDLKMASSICQKLRHSAIRTHVFNKLCMFYTDRRRNCYCILPMLLRPTAISRRKGLDTLLVATRGNVTCRHDSERRRKSVLFPKIFFISLIS